MEDYWNSFSEDEIYLTCKCCESRTKHASYHELRILNQSGMASIVKTNIICPTCYHVATTCSHKGQINLSRSISFFEQQEVSMCFDCLAMLLPRNQVSELFEL